MAQETMASNATEDPPQKPQPPSEEELEKIKSQVTTLVQTWTDLHNARDYSSMLQVPYFTQTFTNISPHRHVKGQTMDTYVEQYKEYIDSCPEFWVKILGISCEFRGSKVLAMVDGEQRIGDGVVLPCFSVLSWVEDGGRWKCCKIDSMRGSAGGMEGVV